MRNHRRDSKITKLQERIRCVLRDAVIAEFDQQVMRLADHVTRRIAEGILEILVREMKIASQQNLGRVTNERLQVRDGSPEVFTIVVVAVIRVWCRNHVADAVSRGCAAHGEADVPRFRAVVYFRKNVRMNVDHNVKNTVYAPGVALIRFKQIRGQSESRAACYQMTGTARERRISLSAVTSGMSSMSAVAPMMRSAGSWG